MAKDRAIGASLMAGSAVGIVVFGWLLFFSEWRIFALELIVFFTLASLLAIAGWIGYTLATSSPARDSQDPKSLTPETGERKAD